jgi:hypothetical protein
MEANELAWCDWMWLVASRFQRRKMMVFCDHEISRRRNGAGAEEQSPKNGMKRLFSAKNLEKDARVEADRHA